MIDFLPNVLVTPGGKEHVESALRAQFEQSLPDAVARYGELPVIMTRSGPFAELLMEARQHFVWGRFYSCVVMCGVTAERILKNLLAHALRMRAEGQWRPLTDEVVGQLERLDVDAIREALLKSGNLDRGLRKPVQKLMSLRNAYAHGRSAQPAEDAIIAIRALHVLVDGTVSFFKDHEIVDGVLTPRTAPVAREGPAADSGPTSP